MPLVKLLYQLYHPRALDPTVFDDQSPGIDLYTPEPVTIAPGQQVLVDTGVVILFPENKIGIIKDKSSVAHHKQIVTQAGVIDTGYRGTVRVLLRNVGQDVQTLQPGDPIAQMLVTTAWQPVLSRTHDPIDTNTFRGTRGFGGTE
ncbi:hypothetical protein JTE90_022655 [Oedothorax gibbosus]|uniref:Deoxyuridine 5'-triphosphate nucleotidohydrolase n=1 Tax=Oedothorax gibbosus TaxID=931172 RepID=A0AAV6TUZ4_9ARAC|nr:hypothetical protein JTE90_022655 [Oedothorax gibbosus]